MILLDAEIKSRQKTEKVKKKLDEFRVTRTCLKLDEIAKLKEELEKEEKQRALIDRTRKSLELQLEPAPNSVAKPKTSWRTYVNKRLRRDHPRSQIRAKTRLEVEVEEAKKTRHTRPRKPHTRGSSASSPNSARR